MADHRETIALCSVGALGKYMCDELLVDGQYAFVVISRQSKKAPFFHQRNIDVRTSDYSVASVLQILDDTNARALISFNNSSGQTFVDVHCAFLEACRKSKTCKRFIPSEFAGNIDEFPEHPSIFCTTRVPFRRILQQEKDVEWTILNNCWLMEYFLPKEKSYMPPIPKEFPIDANGWSAYLRGDGEQVQSFTSAVDVAKSLIALLRAPRWEPTTFICGEWATFNEMVVLMEEFHGRPMKRTYKSVQDIRRDQLLPPTQENEEALMLASVEEMMITGSGACPREKTMRQRKEFFRDIKFTTVRQLLTKARDNDYHVRL